MSKVRQAAELQKVYYVECDNCGSEIRFASMPDPGRKNYCHRCWPICHTNDGLDTYKHIMGARIVGFRFGGGSIPTISAVVLKKGKKRYQLRCYHEDDHMMEHTLDITPGLTLVESCYTFKKQKSPGRVR
jgi:hypothetical protein